MTETTFDNDIHNALFFEGANVTNGNSFSEKWSDIIFSALKAGGMLDNIVISNTPPTPSIPPADPTLWLDTRPHPDLPSVLRRRNRVTLEWDKVTYSDFFDSETSSLTVKSFGVVANDPTAAVDNVAAINAAESWCSENNVDLLYEGLIYCEGRVIWQSNVHRRGVGVVPNLRPAPSTIGASTPEELLTNTSGCELRFIGTGVKDLEFPWVTNASHSGFGRANPRRPYSNAYDARLDLRDFSNQDAVGATPATLRQMSAAVVINNNTLDRIYCEGITIRTACDGTSSDGGTSLEGYTVTDRLPDWADYDIGLLVDSPWQAEFYRLNVIGYWNEAGVLWSSSRNAPEFNDPSEAFRGYAEGNLWRHCLIQSGWVYRTADSWPILAKDGAADTITVPWTASHQFEQTGTIRIGASFVSFATYDYTSVTFDNSGSEPVLIIALDTTDTSGIEVGDNGHHVYFSGGAGPAGTAAYDCEFYDLSPTSLLQEPAYDRPYRAGCEISGGVARAIKLYNCILNPLGFMPIAVGYAPDLQLSDCYSEPRRFRLSHGGPLQDRGGLFICGPDNAHFDLLGDDHNGSLYARGYFQWPGLNMAPLVRVSSTGWFGNLDGDWFNPRSYTPPIEGSLRTSRNVAYEGLRGYEVSLVARLTDGTFYPVASGDGATGDTNFGQVDIGGSFVDFLTLEQGGTARLRGDLVFTTTASPDIKNIRNDNDNIASQSAPTGTGGFRWVESLMQLRLFSTLAAALQLHRLDSGRVAEFRRNGVVSGQIEVYTDHTRYTVNSDGDYLGQTFTTAGRPTAVKTGFYGYDTTLGQPVWKSATGWVDASGNSV
jgi:hypothetical protein